MPKFTSIKALGNAYYLKLFPALTALFGGDSCCSAIVSTLDFLGTAGGELQDSVGEQDGLLWVRITPEKLVQRMDHLYSMRRVQERLQFLVKHKIIVIPEGQDVYTKRTSAPMVFLLDTKGIDVLIKAKQALPFEPPKALCAASNDAGAASNVTADLASNDAVLVTNGGHLTPEMGGVKDNRCLELEKTPNTETETLLAAFPRTPENLQNQNQLHPPLPAGFPPPEAGIHHVGVGDIDENTPIEKFVQQMLSRCGVRWKSHTRANEQTVQRLHADEDDVGKPTIRYAILAMEAQVNGKFEWGKIDYPGAWVAKCWRQYDQIPVSRRQEPAGSNVHASHVPTDPGNEQAAPERDLGALVETWNSIVPEAIRVTRWKRHEADLAEAAAHEDFEPGFRLICERCRDLVERPTGKVTGVNFPWIFRTAKKKPVWQLLLDDFYHYGVIPKEAANGTNGGKFGYSELAALAIGLSNQKPKERVGALGIGGHPATPLP